MSLKQIKWLILLLPTITIGLWEYIRHQFLLDIISMDMGNWLAPIIVFVVTMLVITKLFTRMEYVQQQLNDEKSEKAALQEREIIARELHDGIVQSLFLMSVKVEQMEKSEAPVSYEGLKKIIHEVNTYVRQAIANLRYPPQPGRIPWLDTLQRLVDEMKQDTGIAIELHWNIAIDQLSSKERVELASFIREALWNARKHAHATRIKIEGQPTLEGWQCIISDNGQGFHSDVKEQANKYGIKIMYERAKVMGWSLEFRRIDDLTIVEIIKGKRLSG